MYVMEVAADVEALDKSTAKEQALPIVRQKAKELNISFEEARKHYAHWMPELNEGDAWVTV